LHNGQRFAISILALSQSQPKRKEKTFIVDGALPVPRDLLCAGIELDSDIEIERQHRMEALKAELGAMAAQGNFANAIDKMMGIVLSLEQENERMSWRLLRALRYRFGGTPKSWRRPSSSNSILRSAVMPLHRHRRMAHLCRFPPCRQRC